MNQGWDLLVDLHYLKIIGYACSIHNIIMNETSQSQTLWFYTHVAWLFVTHSLVCHNPGKL